MQEYWELYMKTIDGAIASVLLVNVRDFGGVAE
jgi:hypothetical protein